MDCRHETQFLLGNADGILCRKCGRLFANYTEVMNDRDPQPEQEIPAPKAEAPKKSRKKKEGA